MNSILFAVIFVVLAVVFSALGCFLGYIVDPGDRKSGGYFSDICSNLCCVGGVIGAVFLALAIANFSTRV